MGWVKVIICWLFGNRLVEMLLFIPAWIIVSTHQWPPFTSLRMLNFLIKDCYNLSSLIRKSQLHRTNTGRSSCFLVIKRECSQEELHSLILWCIEKPCRPVCREYVLIVYTAGGD